MEEMLVADFLDLLQLRELVFNRLSISLEQTLELEEATRGQRQSKLWFQHRAGHVTALWLEAAVNSDHSQPRQSIIKQICDPESHQSTSAAQAWGLKHENTSCDKYLCERKKHTCTSL